MGRADQLLVRLVDADEAHVAGDGRPAVVVVAVDRAVAGTAQVVGPVALRVVSSVLRRSRVAGSPIREVVDQEVLAPASVVAEVDAVLVGLREQDPSHQLAYLDTALDEGEERRGAVLDALPV